MFRILQISTSKVITAHSKLTYNLWHIHVFVTLKFSQGEVCFFILSYQDTSINTMNNRKFRGKCKHSLLKFEHSLKDQFCRFHCTSQHNLRLCSHNYSFLLRCWSHWSYLVIFYNITIGRKIPHRSHHSSFLII